MILTPRKASVETPEEEQKRKRERKKLLSFNEDGFVLRAPDTFANQERYPQPSSQKEGLSVRTNQAWRCANFVA